MNKAISARARLLALIESLPARGALPGERQLSERWGLSRMTLRRAVDELIMDGIVERRQGLGTYVVERKILRPFGMLSFSADMQQRGYVVRSRVIKLQYTKATRQNARRLQISNGDDIIRLTRLRLIEREPICLESLVIAAHLVPGLTQNMVRNSWYELLWSMYGIDIITGILQIEPVMLSDEEAVLLDASPSQPCLKSSAVTYDQHGKVIEYGTAIARGDHYKMRVSLHTPRTNETLDGHES